MNFCRRCGAKLTERAPGAYICQNEHRIYKNSFATTEIIFLTKDNDILMTVRGFDPGKGRLDLVGGFIEPDETAEEAAVREITEELGLTPDNYEALKFLCTATSDYDFDGETRPLLCTIFWSRLHPDAQPIPNDDVADIKYFPLASVPLDDVYGKDNRTGLRKFLEIQSYSSL